MRIHMFLGFALVAACADAPDRPRDSVVRDSAGIRIVENATATVTWRLSPDPTVDIGGAPGPDYELFGVSSAVRLSTGTVVVANGGTHELRFYGADGTFVRTVGRQGSGPGEFQNLAWMRRLMEDSLVTYDSRQLRFSVFDSSGAHQRDFRLQTTEAVPFATILGLYANATFLAEGFVNMGGGLPSGLQRYEVPLYHFGTEGDLLKDLGMFSGSEQYFQTRGNGFGSYDAIFPRYTYRLAVGDHLYVAANDTYELRRFTPDGVLTGLVRRTHTPVPVTREHVNLERDRRLAEAASNEARSRLVEALDAMPIPETFPAYHLVRADDDRNVWVKEYPVPGITEATWSVYDPDGFLVAHVAVPLDVDPTHIGRDFLLGRWRGDLNVEHVLLYELVKP